jgi:predicted transcriptional regulator
MRVQTLPMRSQGWRRSANLTNVRRMTDMPNDNFACTTEIVAAYVRHHTVATTELPALITEVFKALTLAGQIEEPAPAARPGPAVPVRKSVTDGYLVCLEDGKKLNMLKRHLKTRYDMTPEEYRQRWGLPRDYPMVAPAYAEQRSMLAKKIGLGRRPAAQPEAAPPLAEESKRRRRPAQGRLTPRGKVRAQPKYLRRPPAPGFHASSR